MQANPTPHLRTHNASPLDLLLRRLAEDSPSAVQAWAADLLEHGEAASGSCLDRQAMQAQAGARKGGR